MRMKPLGTMALIISLWSLALAPAQSDTLFPGLTLALSTVTMKGAHGPVIKYTLKNTSAVTLRFQIAATNGPFALSRSGQSVSNNPEAALCPALSTSAPQTFTAIVAAPSYTLRPGESYSFDEGSNLCGFDFSAKGLYQGEGAVDLGYPNDPRFSQNLAAPLSILIR